MHDVSEPPPFETRTYEVVLLLDTRTTTKRSPTYITAIVGKELSLLMIILWGIVIGVQVVGSYYDRVGITGGGSSSSNYWQLAGTPVFYFLMPLYSFWHMDDSLGERLGNLVERFLRNRSHLSRVGRSLRQLRTIRLEILFQS